jgi:hypothetical protein
MTSICFSRGRLFTKLILRVEGMAAATLEYAPVKAYIVQNDCRCGLIPGAVIGGRYRVNGDGPTKLMAEAVGIELTRRCEGYGRPNACRGVSSVQ